MLGGHGIRFHVAQITLVPDGVEPLGVQSGQEIGAGGAADAVRRIEVVAPAEKAAMVRRMPVLAGVDPRPRQGEQPVDLRHNLNAAGHGQFVGAKGREAALGVHDEQAGGG